MSNNARSFSDISTYQRCAKRYWFRVVNNLQKKKRSTDLFLGTAIHEIMKDYFIYLQVNSTTHYDQLAASVARLMDEFDETTEFEDEKAVAYDLIKEAADIVSRYIQSEDVSNWEVLHVEETFYATLDTGAVISFTPDLVVRDTSGTVWIIDHKSTSRMPTEGIPFGDFQSMLYLVGVQALYPECAGFIYNRLRKKSPTSPRLTKTGDKRVADLRRIDTTYEILKAFLVDEAPDLLDDEAHRIRLAELRDSTGRWFWSEAVYANENAIDTILDEVASTCKTMDEDTTYARNLYEDNGWNSCSKCPFARLCQADLLGWNTDQILNEDYEPRDPKNPYEGEVVDG